MADPTYTYTWGFQSGGPLEYKNGGSDAGLVTAVNWTMTCKDSDGYEYTHKEHTLFDKGDTVTPFENLTKSQVIGWVKTKLGADEVTNIEVSAKNRVIIQRTPPLKIGEPSSWGSS